MSSNSTVDDCSICLNTLVPGAPLLTLSSQNHECPLYRAIIDVSLTQVWKGSNKMTLQYQTPESVNIIPSTEDLVDEEAVRTLSTHLTSSQQATASASSADALLSITATTTLEFVGQPSDQESNIYGLVTVKAPSIILSSESEATSSSSSFSRVPIDLVCVIDQSGSMNGEKITLVKQTLIYIVDQLNELDRLAIVSFNKRAFNSSHGLKRLNQ